MPSDTVPVQTDSAAPAANAAPVVPDTLLQDLQSGAKSMKDLDAPTRAIAMERIKATFGEAENTAAAPAAENEVKPIEQATEKPTAPDAPKPEGEDLQAPMSAKERRKLNQQLADEANTAEQKTRALLARQARAKAELEAAQKAEVKPPEDPWDATHQNNLATEFERMKKRIDFLEKQKGDADQEELDAATTNELTAREKSLFGQFDDLQEEYEPLKTTKPFKQLNEMYSNWLDTELVEKSGMREKMPGSSLEDLRKAAVERYNKDPEFVKTISPYPITGTDAERFNTLLSLHHETATKGGDLEGNWLSRLKRTGKLEEVLQKGRKEAAEDAAKRTVNAIRKANEAVQPVAPGDGAGRGYIDEEWNLTRAQTVQQALVKKHTSGQGLNVSERETLKKVNAILTESFAGST